MGFLRVFLVILAGLFVSGCAQSIYAPDAEVQKRAYSSNEPPSITLITVINNTTGSGGHSAVLVNASQRILYDPAGSWYNAIVPERNDVLFGFSPQVLQAYKSFHARKAFHVVMQTIEVTPEIAEIAYQAALVQGASPNAFCTINTTQLLNKVPGFESIGRTFFPAKAMRDFAKLPGVKTEKYFEDD
jgi:hypothetical protein